MLGRNVVARFTPREQWAASLGYMDVPEASIPRYEEMMDGINAGWIDHGVPGTEHVAGTTTPDRAVRQDERG